MSPPYSGFDLLSIAGEWRHGKGTKVLRDRDRYA